MSAAAALARSAGVAGALAAARPARRAACVARGTGARAGARRARRRRRARSVARAAIPGRAERRRLLLGRRGGWPSSPAGRWPGRSAALGARRRRARGWSRGCCAPAASASGGRSTRACRALALAVADALAGGHSLRGALGEAARSVGGAAGHELRRAVRRAGRRGAAPRTRSRRCARGSRSPRLDTVVAACLLQRRAGGDLARLLRETRRGRWRSSRGWRASCAPRRPRRASPGCSWSRCRSAAALLAELASPGWLAGLLELVPDGWLVGHRARPAGRGGGADPPARAGCAGEPGRRCSPACAAAPRPVVRGGAALASARRRCGRSARARRAAGGGRACSGLLVRAGAPAARRPRAAPRDLEARIAAAGRPARPRRARADGREARRCRSRGAVAGAALSTAAPGRLGVALVGGGPVAGFLAPDLWLARRAAERARRIRRELPALLDLLRVAVESGQLARRGAARRGRPHAAARWPPSGAPSVRQVDARRPARAALWPAWPSARRCPRCGRWWRRSTAPAATAPRSARRSRPRPATPASPSPATPARRPPGPGPRSSWWSRCCWCPPCCCSSPPPCSSALLDGGGRRCRRPQQLTIRWNERLACVPVAVARHHAHAVHVRGRRRDRDLPGAGAGRRLVAERRRVDALAHVAVEDAPGTGRSRSGRSRRRRVRAPSRRRPRSPPGA